MNERNLAIACVLGVMALLVVGYAQAQAANDTTNSTPATGTPASGGHAGHVCPKDAATNAASTATTPATSNASAPGA